MDAGIEMPRYKCSKEVWALKIAAIKRDGEGGNKETDGSAILVPLNARYGPIRVDAAWLQRNPKLAAGGYYVVYQCAPGETENYTAYSPAAPFESGYTKINE